MRYLVRLETHIPDDLEPELLADLNAAETARGIELRNAGVIEHLWRLEGRRANIGVWNVADRAELDETLATLPMRRWIDVAEVVSLLEHPVVSEG